jgi:hypothetical protein
MAIKSINERSYWERDLRFGGRLKRLRTQTFLGKSKRQNICRAYEARTTIRSIAHDDV